MNARKTCFAAPAALLALVALGGCLALPDYSRSEEICRFQAIAIAELPQGRAVYLVSRCTDRLDRNEPCSEHGDHGQFLTVRQRGWRIVDPFQASEGDLTLSSGYGGKYVAFLAPPGGRVLDGAEVLVGEFTSLASWPQAVRVWWRGDAAPALRSETLPAKPEAVAGTGALQVWPIRPTLLCREVSIEYRIDTMLLPLGQTAREHPMGRRKERSCEGLP